MTFGKPLTMNAAKYVIGGERVTYQTGLSAKTFGVAVAF